MPAAAADDSPPVVSYTIDGIAGANDWYRGSAGGDYIVVHWSVSDPDSPIILTSGCEPAIKIDGPNAGTTRTCMATSLGGTTSVTTKVLKIDADPPTGVGASPSRPPDSNGWYNHPVAIAWSGSDAASGIAGCTSLVYGGPDSGGATLNGSCQDAAGNTSAPAAFALRYDATPPRLDRVRAQTYNRLVVLTWRLSPGARVKITRSPARPGRDASTLFVGRRTRFVDRTVRNGATYRYTLTAEDEAGNSTSKTVSARLRPTLFAPAPGARLRSSASPLFAWSSVLGAGYYNIQLWVGGEKVLTAWPAYPRFRLPRHWRFNGRVQRLRPGRYAWYVWPGRGPRRRHAYGPLLGAGTFVVTR